MNIRPRLKRLIERGTHLAATQAAMVGREGRNVEICLAAALGEPGALAKIRYPVAYVEFLRSAIEPMTCSIREARSETAVNDGMSKRFATLVDILETDVPPIGFGTAQAIALLADRHRVLPGLVEYENWAGDLGLLFSISSSFGRKGRILSSIVRFARSERCLDLGTAFGMSALFILSALKANGGIGHLTTLEGLEPQFSLAAALLKGQYGDMVSCHLGMTRDVLPALAKSLGRIDFLGSSGFRVGTRRGSGRLRAASAVYGLRLPLRFTPETHDAPSRSVFGQVSNISIDSHLLDDR